MSQEHAALIALSNKERFDEFIRAAKDTGTLWTLAEEEALMVLGIEGHDEFVVVFPTPEVVSSWFDTSGIEEADLVAMDTSLWIESTLAELTEGGVEVCVFPTADEEGTFTTAAKLKEDLS